MGRIFGRAVVYTLLTTLAAAMVGVAFYALFRPGNLPESLLMADNGTVPENLKNYSLADHFLSIEPDNFLRPMLEGNVLSILLIAFAVGFAISRMPSTQGKKRAHPRP